MSTASVSYRTPLGVAILSVLIGIVGVVFLVVGFLAGLLNIATPGVSSHLFVGGWIGIALLLLFGVVLLAVASGLWDGELWALVLSIIVVGLYFLSDLISGALFTVGGIVLLLLLIYLVAVSPNFT